MSGVATAIAGVGGAFLAGEANKDAAQIAADATPQFAEQLQPGINRQLGRVEDTNVASFAGPRVADFTGQQQAGLGMTDALAASLGAQAGTAGAGFQQFAGGANVGNNPFLEDAIAGTRESAFRDLSRNQLPAIRNNAIGAGGIGGSRQGIAEGLALSDLNRDLANQEGMMRQQQFNQDQTNQLQALIQQSNILSGQTAGQDLRLRTGALQQGQDQANIDASREQFNEQNIDQFNRDQELLRILTGGPAGTPPIPQQTNPAAAGLGTALAFSQLFPGQTSQPIPNPAATGTPGFNPASTNPAFTFG